MGWMYAKVNEMAELRIDFYKFSNIAFNVPFYPMALDIIIDNDAFAWRWILDNGLEKWNFYHKNIVYCGIV